MCAGVDEMLLRDRRILVVEDEYLIADAMQRALGEEGAVVLGPAPSVSEALRLIDTEAHMDGAVLDINLGSEKVFPVAEVLKARAVRFVFATGYDARDVPQSWGHVPRLEKPVQVVKIARTLFGDCQL